MPNTKLNQIVAVEKGVKSKAQREVTSVYHVIQKPALLAGIARTYEPKDDDGDRLPAESTRVQVSVEEQLENFANSLTRLFDVTLTKETANAVAQADVVVDGNVLLANVPVTYLLFLEKQLNDVRTFVAALPTLDPSEVWTRDDNTGAYVTPQTQTVKTKKVPKNWVKAEATDKHPAQVEIFHEDVVVGTWTTVKFSGAIPQTRKTELLERVDKLVLAVKFAREEANGLEITDASAAAEVFGYLFG